MIEFTDRAREILRRTHEAARRFNPSITVRIRRRGTSIEFVLADQAEEDDARVEAEGFEVLVEPGLVGTVDVVEPHDQLVLRPPGRDGGTEGVRSP